MTEQEKQIYNREHYLKNRPKTIQRIKQNYKLQSRRTQPDSKTKSKSILNVVPLFKAQQKDSGSGAPVRSKTLRRFRPNLSTCFLQLLALANTYFLVTETAKFYAATEGSGSNAYLKALVLEGAVFAFSVLMKSRSLLGSLLQQLMILLIYTYSVWTLSGAVIQTAVLDQAQIKLHETTVLELESEIVKKVALRDSYFQADRITLGKRIDQSLDAIRQKLEQSRTFLAHAPSTVLIWHTLLTLIVFRVLVMLSNLFCLRELARRHRLKLRSV